jgi:ComF family protein
MFLKRIICLMTGFINDFVSLFFPKTCVVCGSSLFKNEAVICSRCFLRLPETNFHKYKENEVTQVFWGRIPLEAGTSLYYYKKGGSVQHLLHQFKYKGHREIGNYVGKYYGSHLKESPHFQSVDVIIPIPLHQKKLKTRGFNQAEQFATGLGQSMGVEVDAGNVIRNVETSTQTRKGRYKRWENVSEIFSVTQPFKLENKYILLVDDVITTGATMEACLQTLHKVNGARLGVASMAYAKY